MSGDGLLFGAGRLDLLCEPVFRRAHRYCGPIHFGRLPHFEQTKCRSAPSRLLGQLFRLKRSNTSCRGRVFLCPQ